MTASHCPSQMATKDSKVRVMDISGDKPLKKKRVVSDLDTTPDEAKKKKKKKKKRLDGDSDSLRLPKKISKETALALANQPRRVSKLDRKDGITSILGEAAEDIQQMLEADNNDSAMSLLQKRLLQTVVDLIPYAENNVRESKGVRGVYQINSLITSVRELMIDMQSTRDKGALGDTLVEKIVRPAFLDIGMEMVMESERMIKAIRTSTDTRTYEALKAAHDESLARLAKFVQSKYGEAKQGTIAFMQQ